MEVDKGRVEGGGGGQGHFQLSIHMLLSVYQGNHILMPSWKKHQPFSLLRATK